MTDVAFVVAGWASTALVLAAYALRLRSRRRNASVPYEEALR